MEENTVKISHILFMILIMGIVIIVGTYAWLSYQTNHTAMVLTIGEINSMQVTLSPYQIKASLLPQVTYTSDNYTSVTAINNSTIARDIELYYKINSIDNELISSDFKYTIERSTNGTTYSEYKTGNFSSATNGGELTILEESIPSNTTYNYKVYLWIDGTNSGQGYMQGKSFNGELRADVEQNTYTVTFKDNLFDVNSSNNFNGLTISYDKTTSILTIDGNTSSANTILSIVDGISLNANDIYDFNFEYLSGSVTGNSIAALVADVVTNSNGTNTTPRNNSRRNFIPTFSDGFSQTIDQNAAENGVGFRFWLLLSGSNISYTFDNYKVKVEFYKNVTKEVTYGDSYGDLPIPTRTGYTFLGWINGFSIPEKTGKAWVTMMADNSFVTSNFETGKRYKIEYDIKFNETIPEGWTAGWTSQWGNISLRSGTNPYTYLVATGSGIYGLCGSTFNVGQVFHNTANITMPNDLSTSVLVYYTGLCGKSSDSSARYALNATVYNIIFYDYDDPYGNVNNNTIVQIPNNHTLTAMWQEN